MPLGRRQSRQTMVRHAFWSALHRASRWPLAEEGVPPQERTEPFQFARPFYSSHNSLLASASTPNGRIAAQFQEARLAGANVRGNWDRGRVAVGQTASLRASKHCFRSAQTSQCPHRGRPEDYRHERNRRSLQKRSTLQPLASSRERRPRTAHKRSGASRFREGNRHIYCYTRDKRERNDKMCRERVSINSAQTTVNKILWVSPLNLIQSSGIAIGCIPESSRMAQKYLSSLAYRVSYLARPVAMRDERRRVTCLAVDARDFSLGSR